MTDRNLIFRHRRVCTRKSRTLTYYVTIPTDLKTALATQDSKETVTIVLERYSAHVPLLQPIPKFFVVVVVVFSLTGETRVRSMRILSTTKKSFCYAISPVGLKLMIRHSFFFSSGERQNF